MTQAEKRAAFLTVTLLLVVNIALACISAIYSVVDPLVGLLIVDVLFFGTAVLMWIAHTLFPDSRPQEDDPDKTIEIKRPQGKRC